MDVAYHPPLPAADHTSVTRCRARRVDSDPGMGGTVEPGRSTQTMTHRRLRIEPALGLCLALVATPSLARAQSAQRLSLSGHLGAGLVVSDPVAQTVGLGGGGELRPTLRLFGPVHAQLLAGVQLWSVRGDLQALLPAVGILRLGGGLRVQHALSPRAGSFFVDGDVAASITTGPAQVSFGAGVGWLFPLGRVVQLGPAMRVGYAALPPNDFGFTSLWYGTVGVEIALRVPPPRPPSPDLSPPPAPLATPTAPPPAEPAPPPSRCASSISTAPTGRCCSTPAAPNPGRPSRSVGPTASTPCLIPARPRSVSWCSPPPTSPPSDRGPAPLRPAG